MLRALFLAATILVIPLKYAAAGFPPEPSANAALEYWLAFATLPKFSDAEAQKLWSQYLTMPLDAHTRELLTKSDHALKLTRRGAALARCDWGINFAEDGVFALLPYLHAARTLGYLACISAR